MAPSPYFELSWSILSTIGVINVLFGIVIIAIVGCTAPSVALVVSVATAVANGLCYYCSYTDNPAINKAVASVVADLMWLVQETGLSFYTLIILRATLDRRNRILYVRIFAVLVIIIVAIRMVILVLNVKMTLNSGTVLASLVINNNLHCGYFIAIAMLECVGSFFLVRKFSRGKKAMKQAHLNTDLFHYIMRSTEFRLTLLAVIGLGRAVTHLCNPSFRVVTDLSSQIDRFFYTAECMFPVMIYIDILASRLIHSSLYGSGSGSDHGVGRRSSVARGYTRCKSSPQHQEADLMPEFHHGEDSSGAHMPRDHGSDKEVERRVNKNKNNQTYHQELIYFYLAIPNLY
ncbi:hypothetical protein EDB81DRAFT_916587 [Dactylonectria macrodidyma]|uniref:Uncharacterized protein n=1 Tax=Dactylonectria macrodidyma TaxID=307937 RepID=A0A9P9ICB2_9HYPO|nr:hypothetical protein EDB81DRAFT_916587 [Dactylonectria macrodidyma]